MTIPARTELPLPFEFIIGGSPVSQQSRRRNRVREWTLEVKNAAIRHWDTESPYSGEVKVAITYFFDRSSLDVDNVPKPILDALSGLVYSDDSKVTDLLCRKRDLNAGLQLRNPSPDVLAMVGRSEQFLHVVVDGALSQEVESW